MTHRILSFVQLEEDLFKKTAEVAQMRKNNGNLFMLAFCSMALQLLFIDNEVEGAKHDGSGFVTSVCPCLNQYLLQRSLRSGCEAAGRHA
jgi:hypothetical protein